MNRLSQAGLPKQARRVKGVDEVVNIIASDGSVHLRVKQATRLEHDRVDRALSRFDLTEVDDYAAFLDINHAALTALRSHWRSADEGDFAGLVHALAIDLIELGVEPTVQTEPLSDPIDGLGLSYVVRGSRLGSKILRKRVGSDMPTSYFDFRMGTPWARLLDHINLRGPAGTADEQALIVGALSTFAVYARLARPMDVAA